MGLYERITSDGESDSPEKIPVHIFGVALREWARGNITRANVVNAFNLDAGDQTEINAIAAKYAGLPNANAKLDFLTQMEDAFLAAEAGFYDRDTVASRLGF